jgi:predicted DNA-binding protein YlxM (UPF0122 family)
MPKQTTTQRKHTAMVEDYVDHAMSTKDIAEKYFMTISGATIALRLYLYDYQTDQQKQSALVVADIRADMSKEDIAKKYGITAQGVVGHAKKIGHKFPRKIVVSETTKAIQSRTFMILKRLIHTGDNLACIGVDHDVSREYVRQLQAQCIRFDIPLHSTREV